MRNPARRTIIPAALGGLLVAAGSAGAITTFSSGSSCGQNPAGAWPCLGAFTTTVNTVIDLPPDGILNYTSFEVPSGKTVTFKKNAANTPVTLLVSGDVTIAGTISVNGTAATHSGTAGDGTFGDDGLPGLGGPGGFDGGAGGLSPLFGGATLALGGAGKGPGGGNSPAGPHNGNPTNGAGGGFGGAGTGSDYTTAAGGAAYGQPSLLPLIGGSGGAGGMAGSSFSGAGGGGGGGAILIAASGTINVSGYIYAQGGTGGTSGGNGGGGGGGGGSGGAIRLVANTITRSGGSTNLRAEGADRGCGVYFCGGRGANGIIRMEANSTNWVDNTSPGSTFALPGKVFVPNSPTLTITKVAGNAVPGSPTGVADVTLAQGTTGASVEVAATNIPQGTLVTIYAIPASGATRTSVQTGALTGASDAYTTATSTANVALAPGNNVLLAAATYTVTEIVARALPQFGGEYVAKIRVESELGGGSKVTYITASGKEYPAQGATVKKAS